VFDVDLSAYSLPWHAGQRLLASVHDIHLAAISSLHGSLLKAHFVPALTPGKTPRLTSWHDQKTFI
jgi:hypothetical protein